MNCHANNLEVTDDGQSLDFSGLSEFQINAIALSYLDQIVEFAANTNRNRSMNFDGFMQTRAGEACFVEVDYGNDSLECCRRLVGDFITYEGNIGPIRISKKWRDLCFTLQSSVCVYNALYYRMVCG